MMPAASISPPHTMGPMDARRASRTLIRDWRSLTAGSATARDADRPTLIACSAGRDSSALALALAPRRRATNLVLAHILHDLRPADQAAADRDAARDLAQALDLPFAERRVHVAAKPGNAEAGARRARYAALADLAREHDCAFVATAHHADDQLESILLALVRGAGPRGLAGIAPSRPLAPGITLIRPALALRRGDLAAICAAANHTPAHDATNGDISRARAYIRSEVLPALTNRFPRAPHRAADASRALWDAHAALHSQARDLLAAARVQAPRAERRLARAPIAAAPDAVANEAIRLTLTAVGTPADRIPARTTRAILTALRAEQDRHRTFTLARSELTITAHTIHACPRVAQKDPPNA